MGRKIVFILNSIQQQRCIKRIEEFIDNGYEVDVYGFRRNKVMPTKATRFTIHVLADIPSKMPMWRRFFMMHKTVKSVFNKYKNDDVVFYFFLLDVALVCRSVSKQRYIYENSDLMYGYYIKPIQLLFRLLDKWIIKKSLLSILTSGGFVEYLFKGEKPENVIVVPNRINKAIRDLPYKEKEIDQNHLSFAFVGFVRQPATRRFAEVLLSHFPQHEFHVYGLIHEAHLVEYEELSRKYHNIHLHGAFSNPKDLPAIYENIDIIVSAIGDVGTANVLYSEPNKLYECIYFRKPIIAPSIGYWGDKVKRLGLGFSLNDTTEAGIVSLIKGITKESIKSVQDNIARIPQNEAIDDNPELFKMLREVW